MKLKTPEYPKDIDDFNKYRYFILLVNLLAVYDYEDKTNIINYTFLIKLMFALFGEWVYYKFTEEKQNKNDFINILSSMWRIMIR